MSLLDVARETLKDIPMADVLRERLSLAFDQSAIFEKQVAELQMKVGGLTLILEQEQSRHAKTREELQRLKEEYAEEVRIWFAIELRRGKRTGGMWMAFCPKCHIPLKETSDYTFRCPSACGWVGMWPKMPLTELVREMEESGET